MDATVTAVDATVTAVDATVTAVDATVTAVDATVTAVGITVTAVDATVTEIYQEIKGNLPEFRLGYLSINFCVATRTRKDNHSQMVFYCPL